MVANPVAEDSRNGKVDKKKIAMLQPIPFARMWVGKISEQ
jgi:hypothetical protein